MGCSFFLTFFFIKTTAKVFSEVNENIIKYKVKSAMIKVGLVDNENLTPLKELLASSDHLSSVSFFSMSVISLKCSTRFGMNLLKKLIFPLSD